MGAMLAPPCAAEMWDESACWPGEVQVVLSALEAGGRPVAERHKLARVRYRVRASLQLYSDGQGAPPWMLYTRHVHQQALGFLSSQFLPLSHGGVLTLRGRDGRPMKIACTILRCRQVGPGWYEGAVYFNRSQEQFAAENFANE